jgi:predicted metal-binding membrane protein
VTVITHRSPLPVTRRHPEWWLAAAAAGGWVAVLQHGLDRAGAPAPSLPGALIGWMVMVLAMMAPTAIPMVRYVAWSSLLVRQDRSVAWFLVGFLGAWLPFGVVAALWHVHQTGSAAALTAGALVLAASWELSPWKRRALLRCHRTAPIRARGLAADRSCAWFGLRFGGRCVVTCGPVMGALVVSGHPVLLTGAVAAATAVQRTSFQADRLRAPMAALLLTLALVALV